MTKQEMLAVCEAQLPNFVLLKNEDHESGDLVTTAMCRVDGKTFHMALVHVAGVDGEEVVLSGCVNSISLLSGGKADAGACGHFRTIVDRDENDNRIRTHEHCPTCKADYYGCLAKRLDEEGREAWGKPGVQGYSRADS